MYVSCEICLRGTLASYEIEFLCCEVDMSCDGLVS